MHVNSLNEGQLGLAAANLWRVNKFSTQSSSFTLQPQRRIMKNAALPSNSHATMHKL